MYVDSVGGLISAYRAACSRSEAGKLLSVDHRLDRNNQIPRHSLAPNQHVVLAAGVHWRRHRLVGDQRARSMGA
jgi:hypothetical protein